MALAFFKSSPPADLSGAQNSMSPVTKRDRALERPHSYVDVAIIGGGFSGSMLAIHFAHTLRTGLEVALVEKQDRLGAGTNYSAELSGELLSLQAVQAGAYPDQPEHFLTWLNEHPDLLHQFGLENLSPDSHVPRPLYGLYIELLTKKFALRSKHVHLFGDHAVDFYRRNDGALMVALAGGASIYARKVVLSSGHLSLSEPVYVSQLIARGLLHSNDRKIETAQDGQIKDVHGALIPNVYALGAVRNDLKSGDEDLPAVRQSALDLAGLLFGDLRETVYRVFTHLPRDHTFEI